MNEYTGLIIEESLNDKHILNELVIIITQVAGDWHITRVKISKDKIESLPANLVSDKYYMHFWKDDDVIVVFKDKIMTLKHSDRESWKPIIEYGKSIGIPEEQLDFPID